ncbi:MAG: hypothetical protein LBK68_06425 [Candidatus Margulisbacteria bacterium]|jgi:hypothetical protein|nr:hypothetical protein [Candidatus Margulisiibacteriota bacterium]
MSDLNLHSLRLSDAISAAQQSRPVGSKEPENKIEPEELLTKVFPAGKEQYARIGLALQGIDATKNYSAEVARVIQELGQTLSSAERIEMESKLKLEGLECSISASAGAEADLKAGLAYLGLFKLSIDKMPADAFPPSSQLKIISEITTADGTVFQPVFDPQNADAPLYAALYLLHAYFSVSHILVECKTARPDMPDYNNNIFVNDEDESVYYLGEYIADEAEKVNGYIEAHSVYMKYFADTGKWIPELLTFLENARLAEEETQAQNLKDTDVATALKRAENLVDNIISVYYNKDLNIGELAYIKLPENLLLINLVSKNLFSNVKPRIENLLVGGMIDGQPVGVDSIINRVIGDVSASRRGFGQRNAFVADNSSIIAKNASDRQGVLTAGSILQRNLNELQETAGYTNRFYQFADNYNKQYSSINGAIVPGAGADFPGRIANALNKLAQVELAAAQDAQKKDDILSAYKHYQNAQKYLDITGLGFVDPLSKEPAASLTAALIESTKDNRAVAEQAIAGILTKLDELESRFDSQYFFLDGKLTQLTDNAGYLPLYYILKKPVVDFWRDNIFAQMSSPRDLRNVIDNKEFKAQAALYLDDLPQNFAEQAVTILKDPQARNNNQNIISTLSAVLFKEYESFYKKDRWWPHTTDKKDPAYTLIAVLNILTLSEEIGKTPPLPTVAEIVEQTISTGELVVTPLSGETSSTFKNVEISDFQETSGGLYEVTNQAGYDQANTAYQGKVDARDNADTENTAKAEALETATTAAETARDNKDAKRDAVTDAQGVVSDRTGDVTDIQNDINSTQGDLNTVTTAVSTNETLVSNAQAEVTAAQGNYDTAQSDFETKENAYNQAVTNVSTAEGLVTQAQDNLDIAQQNFDDDPNSTTSAALQAAKDALFNANNDLSTAQNAEQTTESVKNLAENERDSRLDTLNDKKDDLTDKQNDLTAVLSEQSDLQTTLNTMQNQLTSAQDNLAAAQKALSDAQSDETTSDVELAAKEQALQDAQAEATVAEQALQTAQTALDNASKPSLKDFSEPISSLNGKSLKDLKAFNKDGDLIDMDGGILNKSAVRNAAGEIIGILYSEIDPNTNEKTYKFFYIKDGVLQEAKGIKIVQDADGKFTIKAEGDSLHLWEGGPEIGYFNNTSILGSMLRVEGYNRANAKIQVSNANGAFIAKKITGPDGQEIYVPIVPGDVGAELQDLLALTQTSVDPDTGAVYADLSVPPEIIRVLIDNGYVLLLTGEAGEKTLGALDIVGADNVTLPEKTFQPQEFNTNSPKSILDRIHFTTATPIPGSSAETTSDPDEAKIIINYGGGTIELKAEEELPAGILRNPKTGKLYIAGYRTIKTIIPNKDLGKSVQAKSFNGALDPDIVKEPDRALGGELDLQLKIIDLSVMTRDFFDKENSIFDFFQSSHWTGLLLNGEYLRFDDQLVQQAMQEIKDINAAKDLSTGYEDLRTLLTLVELKRRYKNGIPSVAKQRADLLEYLQKKYQLSLKAEDLNTLSLHDLAARAAASVVLDERKAAVYKTPAQNSLQLTAGVGMNFTSLGVDDFGKLTENAGLALDWQTKLFQVQLDSTYYLDHITGAADYAWEDKSASRLENSAKLFWKAAENFQPYFSYRNGFLFPHDSDEWISHNHLFGFGARGQFFWGKFGNSATGKGAMKFNYDLLLFDQFIALEENGIQYNNTGLTGKVSLDLGAFTFGLDSTVFWRNHAFLADNAIYRAVDEALVSPKFRPSISYSNSLGAWSFGGEIGPDFAKGSVEEKLNLAYKFPRFTIGAEGHASQYFSNPWFSNEAFEPKFGGGGSLFADIGKYHINIGADVQPGSPGQAPQVDVNIGFKAKIDFLNLGKKAKK